MQLEEYMQKIDDIHKELEDIAKRTMNLAIAGSANLSNPLFVKLMQRHAQLTKLASEFTECMISQVNVSN